jgi:hypothetical protein
VPARGLANRSRAASGITSAGITTGAQGASAGLGQDNAGSARRTGSQETWPGVEKPRPRNLGQNRGGAPRGERVPQDARPSPEAQMDGNIRCVARPHGTVAPFRRSASLHFFEAKEFVALVGKPRARVRRENESACRLFSSAARGSFAPRAGRRMG